MVTTQPKVLVIMMISMLDMMGKSEGGFTPNPPMKQNLHKIPRPVTDKTEQLQAREYNTMIMRNKHE